MVSFLELDTDETHTTQTFAAGPVDCFAEEIMDFAHRLAAGGYVISHHHGRCRDILEDIAGYGTYVVEPLEAPPMGDVNLAEATQRVGDTCCLKGNVGTIDVLLQGTVADVERAVRDCMAAAKDGYGFILATGDQVARDTPLENFRALVQCGRKYGAY